ncbi:6-phosphogluconolactonase [Jonesia quinghaiensis]|uniref:6-phosphogluconolactonase n=1 Tax=Jonesia quinghaiensis TaxID=262806 RepID=UPI000402E4C8|nr:6-phosphogluconolactonase [Jonesia quinghaiensis]
MTRSVILHQDATFLAQATAARLLMRLHELAQTQNRVDIVLTGGTVGIATLAEMSSSPLRMGVDWTVVHVWWGDERFVASDSPDRNEGQATEALLSQLPIPPGNIHRMASAKGDTTAETGAVAYANELSQAVPGEVTPFFDVLLLGMGPDGHVASLFPEHPTALTSGVVVAVHDSPKPPPTRISLTFDTINRARQVWVVAAGEEKAPAVARALARVDPVATPASAVRGTEKTLWLVDASAAADIVVPPTGQLT